MRAWRDKDGDLWVEKELGMLISISGEEMIALDHIHSQDINVVQEHWGPLKEV